MDSKTRRDVRETNDTAFPNVILLMSDDQGWGDVGFNGNEKIHTPHLDAMAAEGVRFNRFYASAPLCSPTRGGCLTGRYPFRFGVLAAHTGGMRVGEITIAEMLKSKGYRTGFFGKWHLGWVKESDAGSRGFYSPPSQHGFDTHFATTSAVPTWDPTMTPGNWSGWGSKPGEPWKGGTPYVRDGIEVARNMAGDDSRIIMDRVIPFIEENREQPFFATVWFHAPHEPVVAGAEYRKRYAKYGTARQNLYGCITAMDEQIGRLRTRLDELGLSKSTVVFFCSDNGPADKLTRKGVASAGPFRGHKHTMYEGGLLVPACAVWPGVIPAGTTTDVRCSTLDYFPTIAKFAGYEFASKDERPSRGSKAARQQRSDDCQSSRGSTIADCRESHFRKQLDQSEAVSMSGRSTLEGFGQFIGWRRRLRFFALAAILIPIREHAAPRLPPSLSKRPGSFRRRGVGSVPA